MANEKFLKGRFQQKTDIEKNWEKAKNFIPLDGEIIVYKDIKKLKVGDGVTTVGNLEFYTGEIDEKIFEDYVKKDTLEDYVTKEDAVGKKNNVNGEIFNSLKNQAIGTFSHAEGVETMAGCMGYYVAAIDPANNHIYLHTGENAVIPTWDNPSSLYDANFESGYQILNDGKISSTEIASREEVNCSDLIWEECDRWTVGNDQGDDICLVERAQVVSAETEILAILGTYTSSGEDAGADIVPWEPIDLTHPFDESMNSAVSFSEGYIYRYTCLEYGNTPYEKTIATISYEIVKEKPVEGEYTSYGNEFSISANSYYHWAFAGNMTAIRGNRITYSSETLNTSEKWLSNVNNGADPCIFYIPAQHQVGIVNIGYASHAEGWETHAAGEHSHTEGYGSIVAGRYGHAEGNSTRAGFAAHSEGVGSLASGLVSHAEGGNTIASGERSHAEGSKTVSEGSYSHAEGYQTSASGAGAHAEGCNTEATGVYSHAEGFNTDAIGQYSHAEGRSSKASGDNSHSEGYSTTASAHNSHAEGLESKASAEDSHAEGYRTEASGFASHTEGGNTKAKGSYSHAEGYGTIVSKNFQHVQGKYNIEDTENKYAHIVGNGTKENKRSNAHTLDWDGNAWFAGDVESGSGKLATEDYVNDKISQGDWEENDSNNPAYIKNRTHWVEKTKQVLIFDGVIPGYSSVSIDNAEAVYELKDGDILLANVNGEECSGTVHIKETETNKIMIVYFIEGPDIYYEIENDSILYRPTINNDTDSDIDVKIYTAGNQVVYHKLDKNYLPSDITYGYVTAGRLADSVVGSRSTAEGYMTTASNNDAHAEGNSTTASGYRAHAEGMSTKATGNNSHSEGQSTIAEGSAAHAEGRNSKAQGRYSHASGLYTQVKGIGATVIGVNNILDQSSSTILNASNNLFIIGNGKIDGAETTKSNAFRVDAKGNVYAANTSMNTGADYAEYFEWSDGNTNNEDRIGRFVTLDNGGQIKIANTGDDILGVVSGHASIIGDAYEDAWSGMYERDIYGRLQYEEVEVEYEDVDDDGNIITQTTTETHIKLNPNYNPTQTYVPRSQRPEWDAIGLMGKLVIIDDGSCIVGGKCVCGADGTATMSDAGYYVLKRLDKTHVQILFK